MTVRNPTQYTKLGKYIVKNKNGPKWKIRGVLIAVVKCLQVDTFDPDPEALDAASEATGDDSRSVRTRVNTGHAGPEDVPRGG